MPGADETSEIVYKPVGPALGAVSGGAAGGLFKQVWKQLKHDDAPDAIDEERTWREVIRAAVRRPARSDLRRCRSRRRP
ncbi:hypothetical protein GCM10010304_60300 [Streptomyces roseoviolaceus]